MPWAIGRALRPRCPMRHTVLGASFQCPFDLGPSSHSRFSGELRYAMVPLVGLVTARSFAICMGVPCGRQGDEEGGHGGGLLLQGSRHQVIPLIRGASTLRPPALSQASPLGPVTKSNEASSRTSGGIGVCGEARLQLPAHAHCRGPFRQRLWGGTGRATQHSAGQRCADAP